MSTNAEILARFETKLGKLIQLYEGKTLDELEKELDGFNRDNGTTYSRSYQLFDFSWEGISGSIYQYEGARVEIDPELWYYEGDIEEPLVIAQLVGWDAQTKKPLYIIDAIDSEGIQW